LAMAAQPMLEIKHMVAGYGRVDVLRDITLAVREGAIVGLLGPNGAGKSTLIKSVSGQTRVRAGQILFEGKPIHDRAPEDIVAMGIIQVPQGRMLFPELSVEDNLQLGAYRQGARRMYQATFDLVERHFPILRERRQQRAGLLSGGEQQMLAVGRAMMAQPRLLILDEPSLGLAPRIIDNIFDVLRKINADGITILVAEQNAMKVLQTAETVYVLENGSIAHAGTSQALAQDATIQRSYLGI
jgi:branched-chain amino acid transport system ATP-binding protein